MGILLRLEDGGVESSAQSEDWDHRISLETGSIKKLASGHSYNISPISFLLLPFPEKLSKPKIKTNELIS